tara:strand:- start:29 stop:217 length:189 start_codon:yes stop_codon:yes gene_type:complete
MAGSVFDSRLLSVLFPTKKIFQLFTNTEKHNSPELIELDPIYQLAKVSQFALSGVYCANAVL